MCVMKSLGKNYRDVDKYRVRTLLKAAIFCRFFIAPPLAALRFGWVGKIIKMILIKPIAVLLGSIPIRKVGSMFDHACRLVVVQVP